MENKPASLLVVSSGKVYDGTSPPLRGRQVAQFSLQKVGWWQEGHPTVKQMPCDKNANRRASSLATRNREKPKTTTTKLMVEVVL